MINTNEPWSVELHNPHKVTINDKLLEVVWSQVIHLVSVIVESLAAAEQATGNHTKDKHCKIGKRLTFIITVLQF